MTRENFIHIEGVEGIIYTIASTFLPPVGATLRLDGMPDEYRVVQIAFDAKPYPYSDTMLQGDPTLTIADEDLSIPTLYVERIDEED
jgi:hypothetical protein